MRSSWARASRATRTRRTVACASPRSPAGWRRRTASCPRSALFHAVVEKRHLATPDGIVVDADGRVTLCEIKTTNKSWRSIPRTYLRQVWWQQHVLGAERTLVVWEEHDGFVPSDDEPRCAWVDRDEAEIAQARARWPPSLIDELHRRTTQRPPVAPAAAERMPRPTPREPFRALALAD